MSPSLGASWYFFSLHIIQWQLRRKIPPGDPSPCQSQCHVSCKQTASGWMTLTNVTVITYDLDLSGLLRLSWHWIRVSELCSENLSKVWRFVQSFFGGKLRSLNRFNSWSHAMVASSQWLQVNHAPSFATESELDHQVKHEASVRGWDAKHQILVVQRFWIWKMIFAHLEPQAFCREVLQDTFNLLDLNPDVRRQKKREAGGKVYGMEIIELHVSGFWCSKSLQKWVGDFLEHWLVGNPQKFRSDWSCSI